MSKRPKYGSITIEDLLVNPEYSNVSLDELEDLIGNVLNFEEYKELEGFSACDKALILFKQQWGRTL